MTSNKDRYNRELNRRSGGGSSKPPSNGPMWFIIYIIIIAVLASVYMVWNEGVLGKGDLNIGIGAPNPDADAIGKYFR